MTLADEIETLLVTEKMDQAESALEEVSQLEGNAVLLELVRRLYDRMADLERPSVEDGAGQRALLFDRIDTSFRNGDKVEADRLLNILALGGWKASVSELLKRLYNRVAELEDVIKPRRANDD